MDEKTRRGIERWVDQRMRIAEHIERIVAAAPPLSQEQIDKLTVLLSVRKP